MTGKKAAKVLDFAEDVENTKKSKKDRKVDEGNLRLIKSYIPFVFRSQINFWL